MSETASVEVTVLNMVAVTGGTTLAHADVSLLIAGVEIIIRNLKVSRLRGGRLGVELPTTRDPAGRWAPSMTLPEELHRPIASAVLAHYGCGKMVY
ncbi:hypothetical protein [Magnetospirillum sp. 15-1]|uniref:hypothetical protein n=1 Tax=Magnetospirillum sp. 15-1 TaxID=1979370 RepID=UPI00114516A2|nr:hypothetical protein [Magnetospirillum sp. 15-1]MDO8608834.1 hypothetical protein [Phaeospirillum sp.]